MLVVGHVSTEKYRSENREPTWSFLTVRVVYFNWFVLEVTNKDILFKSTARISLDGDIPCHTNLRGLFTARVKYTCKDVYYFKVTGVIFMLTIYFSHNLFMK